MLIIIYCILEFCFAFLYLLFSKYANLKIHIYFKIHGPIVHILSCSYLLNLDCLWISFYGNSVWSVTFRSRQKSSQKNFSSQKLTTLVILNLKNFSKLKGETWYLTVQFVISHSSICFLNCEVAIFSSFYQSFCYICILPALLFINYMFLKNSFKKPFSFILIKHWCIDVLSPSNV